MIQTSTVSEKGKKKRKERKKKNNTINQREQKKLSKLNKNVSSHMFAQLVHYHQDGVKFSHKEWSHVIMCYCLFQGYYVLFPVPCSVWFLCFNFSIFIYFLLILCSRL